LLSPRPQVKPTDTVTIKLQAESYLGTSVNAAPIDVEWSTGKAKGTVNATTGTAPRTVPGCSSGHC
jgi:hypothetical protein